MSEQRDPFTATVEVLAVAIEAAITLILGLLVGLLGLG